MTSAQFVGTGLAGVGWPDPLPDSVTPGLGWPESTTTDRPAAQSLAGADLLSVAITRGSRPQNATATDGHPPEGLAPDSFAAGSAASDNLSPEGIAPSSRPPEGIATRSLPRESAPGAATRSLPPASAPGVAPDSFGRGSVAINSLLKEQDVTQAQAAEIHVSRETPEGLADLPVDVSRETPERLADLPVDDPGETSVATADLTRPAAAAALPRGADLPRPAQTRILTVANQKGGVGKTTTTVNLAAALALHGAQVLVIDLDPQGNASTALGVDHGSHVASVYDVLVEGRPLHEVVAPAQGIPGLACAPATVDLAGAEIELVSLVARELRLQRALRTYLRWRAEQDEPRLDYVFIDCPPSLGLLTVNALVAAPEVLIPIQCEYYALEGVGQLVSNVEMVKAHLNQDLHVSTIMLTMYDARTRLAAQVADDVRRHFTDVVLRTTIPRSVRISEAPSYGQTVMTYDPASTGALSYREAAREIAFRGATRAVPVDR